MARRKLLATLVLTVAVPMLSVQTVARADVIGAEEYLQAVDRHEAIDNVNEMLARDDVQRALKQHGVDPAEAAERVAALNDQELRLLAEDLDELPVGGSLLGAVGIAFIVLLILELVGVTDVFSKI